MFSERNLSMGLLLLYGKTHPLVRAGLQEEKIANAAVMGISQSTQLPKTCLAAPKPLYTRALNFIFFFWIANINWPTGIKLDILDWLSCLINMFCALVCIVFTINYYRFVVVIWIERTWG